MNDCPHRRLDAHVDVNRLEDSTTWYAEVHVRCVDCDAVARFFGPDVGLDPGRPTISPMGETAILPFRVILPAAAWKWDGGELSAEDQAAWGNAVPEGDADADA